jgi:hypothetical protein
LFFQTVWTFLPAGFINFVCVFLRQVPSPGNALRRDNINKKILLIVINWLGAIHILWPNRFFSPNWRDLKNFTIYFVLPWPFTVLRWFIWTYKWKSFWS